MSGKSNAGQMAIEGLEMGFRVLGNRVNTEVLAHCGIKDRINCGTTQKGDSMATARDLLVRSLPVLAPLEVRTDQVLDQWPWILGCPTGFGNDEERQSMKWVCRVRLGVDEHEPWEDAVIESYKSNKWSPDTWRAWVIEPMEQRQKEVREWILSFMPKRKYSGGPDGFRRDARIYELASAGETNDEIIRIIGEEADDQDWRAISSHNAIRDALARYCRATQEPPLPLYVRNGRPKSNRG